MSLKRNRAINWDEAEKQLFRAVMKNYIQIIENKSLDTNTNRTKIKAWEEIHKKFNALNSRPRDLSQLRIQWKTMKIRARKVCSTFKKEVNKTVGGAKPSTPDNSVLEIEDLLIPSELLRDHNIYDSDGIMIDKINNISNQQLDISGDDITVVTPKTKSIGMNPANNVPKRKIILNNVVGNGSKPREDREEYVSRMLSYSKLLKDEEHMRHMEMAEEEHKIKMEIHKEKLNSAILEKEINQEKLKAAQLEREILELKKGREASYNN